MFGVSYQGWARQCESGIRPVSKSLRRMRQNPKFGNDTIARRPIRTSSSTTRRGRCVACRVWLSTTTSNASAGLAQLDAAPVDALLPCQIAEQGPIAATDVEHTRPGFDHLGDQPQILTQL